MHLKLRKASPVTMASRQGSMGMTLRVHGSELRVRGSELRVHGSELRVHGSRVVGPIQV